MVTSSSASSRSTGWRAARCRGGIVRRVSVLSNGGLEKAISDAGGRVARTPVGDKYILDGMLVMDAGLGGEKSGHVIIREHTNAGDGIVTALEVLGIIARTRQAAVRARCANSSCFHSSSGRSTFVTRTSGRQIRPSPDAVEEARRRSLGNGGRILVRPSGTEPALRIMVEGEDDEAVASHRRLASRRSPASA